MQSEVIMQPEIRLTGVYLSVILCSPAGTCTLIKAPYISFVSTFLPSIYTDHPLSYGIEHIRVASLSALTVPFILLLVNSDTLSELLLSMLKASLNLEVSSVYTLAFMDVSAETTITSSGVAYPRSMMVPPFLRSL